MSTTCTKCGAEAKTGEHFIQRDRSFRLKKANYCPPCWERQQSRERKLAVGLIAVSVILIPIIVVVFWEPGEPGSAVAWHYRNLGLVCVAMMGMIVLHELGHALAARALGWHVFSITLGTGRTLCRFRLAGFPFEIKAVPLTGFVSACPRTPVLLRTKYFLFALAGPGANLVMLAFALYFLDREALWAPGAQRVSAALVLALVNLFVAAAALCPYKFKIDFGYVRLPVSSDGLVLMTAPFLSSKRIEEMHASYFLVEALECLQLRQYAEARQWHLQALEMYPEDISNRINLATTQSFLNQHQEARANALQALNHKDLLPALRPLLLNNIAWYDLVLGDPDLLNEADRFSQESLGALPACPEFQGTRGSILVEKGDIAAGLALLRQAMAGNEDPRNKSLNACFIAIGECKVGNPEAAMHTAQLARNLDQDCILLPKVERLLADACATQGNATSSSHGAP